MVFLLEIGTMQIVSSSFSARDDRLQKNLALVVDDIGDQVGVIHVCHHHDPLVRVLGWVWMRVVVEKPTGFDRDDDLGETNTALLLQ